MINRNIWILCTRNSCAQALHFCVAPERGFRENENEERKVPAMLMGFALLLELCISLAFKIIVVVLLVKIYKNTKNKNKKWGRNFTAPFFV